MTAFLQKLIRQVVIPFSGLFLFTTCNHSADQQVSALKEWPKILTVSIPGIPKESISINQDEHVITVQLPSELALSELNPSFAVSEQAAVVGSWSKPDKTIKLNEYCACSQMSGPTSPEVVEEVRVDNRTTTSYYKIKINRDKQPIKINSTEFPIVYEYSSAKLAFYLPAENLYDSPYVPAISISPAGSGKSNWIGGEGCLSLCDGGRNKLGIAISGYLIRKEGQTILSLKPALYDVDLRFSDGSEKHLAGALLIK